MATIEPDKQKRMAESRTRKLFSRSATTGHFIGKQPARAAVPAQPAAAPFDESAGQTVIELNDASFRAFEAALDRPAKVKPRLAKLLSEKSVLED